MLSVNNLRSGYCHPEIAQRQLSLCLLLFSTAVKLCHWRIWGGASQAHAPLRDQILSFSHTFLPESTTSEVHAPLMGPRPPYGKSWIRHCIPIQITLYGVVVSVSIVVVIVAGSVVDKSFHVHSNQCLDILDQERHLADVTVPNATV